MYNIEKEKRYVIMWFVYIYNTSIEKMKVVLLVYENFTHNAQKSSFHWKNDHYKDIMHKMNKNITFLVDKIHV